MSEETEKNTTEIVECQCCYCRAQIHRDINAWLGFRRRVDEIVARFISNSQPEPLSVQDHDSITGAR